MLRYRFSRNARQRTVDKQSQSQMLPRPLNAALYHAGDIGRARAAARVLRIFRGSSSRKPDDEVVRDVSRRPPTRRYIEFLYKVSPAARHGAARRAFNFTHKLSDSFQID